MTVLLGAINSAKDPMFSKSIFISSPGATENIDLFYANVGITVTKIVCILVGSSSPSVTWTVRFDTDRSATGTEVVTGGTTTTSTTTGSIVTSFNNASISSTRFVWVKTTAQSGTVTSMAVHIFYDLA